MEQFLTTVALIVGGIFAVWILFSDPVGEDGKGGQMDAALLGALVMIPFIILLIIGIVLFLPILLGIIIVLFLAYGAYLGLKWLFTREREEKEDRKERKKGQEGEEGRLRKTIQKTRETFSNAWNSRPSRAVRERTKKATVTIRNTVKEKGGRLKTNVSKRLKDVREKGPKKIREKIQYVKEVGVRERVQKAYRQRKERLTRVGTYEERSDAGHQDSSSRSKHRTDSVRHRGVVRERTDSDSSSKSTHRTDSVRHRAGVVRERRHSDSSSDTSADNESMDTSHTSRSRTRDTQAYGSEEQTGEPHNGRREERDETRKSRLQKWRSALRQNWKKSGDRSPSTSAENPSKQASSVSRRKSRSAERSHAHDPLTNMRTIGWNTRRHLGEVYHHRKKSR